MSFSNLKLISAGAGSGKTYRLTAEMTELLTTGKARPAGIIATTFTKRAAAELRERVRVKLLREGMSREAAELRNALIGTVHGLGVKLLQRFAFEAGVSPQVDIIADEDHQRLFNLSMANVIPVDTISEIERLCEVLGLSRDGAAHNWRREVLQLVEVIRGNNFQDADIAHSQTRSWEQLQEYLPDTDPALTPEHYRTTTITLLESTVEALMQNEADGTKTTQTVVSYLRKLRGQLERRGTLPWYEYAKLAGLAKKTGAKSRELVGELAAHGAAHTRLAAFQDDLRQYQSLIFENAKAAITEYEQYKKSRGRIDYTDMEVLVLQLLDNPAVQDTLRRELDLLMVDEFQDTSPIQLAVFLKLSRLARQSVWVGDPKQSIYGFRGAEPRLMRAVIDATGPLDPANIQPNSWRSREDIVYACNAIFTKAFPEIPVEAVALAPVRQRKGSAFSAPESPALAERSAIRHWHFELDGKGRISRAWQQEAVAKALFDLLANPPLCQPKGATAERPIRPGDVAILCRSNANCRAMAEALNRQGLRAAIARTGLLQTAEATLMLACLKYMLNRQDSLSVAEIMLFGERHGLPAIIEDRLDWLEAYQSTTTGNHKAAPPWGHDHDLVQTLNALRQETAEYAASELLNLLLERLDLRRTIVAWGNGEQRLSNIDELRRLAVAYEDNCHRQHRAASLGGYLLYLDSLLRADKDTQGASEQPAAVNVLTYHRSKGLEWPVVLCLDLDQPLRAEVWGLAVINETEKVDLANPLAGRWLKYWVNPYGKSGGDLPWLSRLQASVWQETATEEALAEEARLLYVGFTRARDYLILPTTKNGAPWLDRAYARGDGITPVLDPNSTDAPFDWQGQQVSKYLQTLSVPRNLPATTPPDYPTPFLTEVPYAEVSHAPAAVTDGWLLEHFPGVTAAPVVYYSPNAPDPATDLKLLGEAISRFLAGNVPPLAADLQAERAAALLEQYLPGGEPTAEQLCAQADAFQQWLATLEIRNVARQVVVSHDFNGRRFSSRADWVLTLADETQRVIFDVTASGTALESQLAVTASRLRAWAAAARAQGLYAPETLYIHLPLTGSLLAVNEA